MNIKELKELQENNLKSESITNQIKESLREYNEECITLNARFDLSLANIILDDVYNFLEESGLEYDNADDNSKFRIKGTKIEIITYDDRLKINNDQENQIGQYMISLLDEKYKLKGFVHQCIKVNEDSMDTYNEEMFLEKLKLKSIEELYTILEALNNAIKDVKQESNRLLSIDNNYKDIKHDYYLNVNENMRFKTIKEIIEHEI